MTNKKSLDAMAETLGKKNDVPCYEKKADFIRIANSYIESLESKGSIGNLEGMSILDIMETAYYNYLSK